MGPSAQHSHLPLASAQHSHLPSAQHSHLHSATPRKIQLVLGSINSPIILAIDLTDLINPAHSQQLQISTLMIIGNRIPVE